MTRPATSLRPPRLPAKNLGRGRDPQPPGLAPMVGEGKSGSGGGGRGEDDEEEEDLQEVMEAEWEEG